MVSWYLDIVRWSFLLFIIPLKANVSVLYPPTERPPPPPPSQKKRKKTGVRVCACLCVCVCEGGGIGMEYCLEMGKCIL